MTDPAVRERPVARIVVIDRVDRVLLFDTRLAYTTVWMTPGGAIEGAETPEAAAHRELWEETGLEGVSLSPCIWRVRFRFRHGGVVYEQQERYFATRVDGFDPTPVNREAAERAEIRGHRWWSAAEIAQSTASFRPRGLGALLPPVLAGEYPDTPLDAQVERGARVV